MIRHTSQLLNTVFCFIVLSALQGCGFLWEQTRQPRACATESVNTIPCDTCTSMVAQGSMEVLTVANIIDSVAASPSDTTLLMFINSGCPDFPVTMPHFLDALKTRSGIRPMLIFSDDHTNANTARQRAVSWGWHERMYILDQDECGCYMDTRQRHTVMLQKLAISAPDKYHLTVNLLVLMSKRGAVLDTSQYLDMAHL